MLSHFLRTATTKGGKIAFVTSVTGSNVSSLTFPVSLQQNDIVIYAGSYDGRSVTLPNTPTGYTDFGTGTGNPPNITRKVSYKIMGATPDTTISGLMANTDTAHAVVVFRGTSGTPATVTAAIGSGSTPDAPSITGVTQNAVVLAFGFLRATTQTAPTGYTIVNSNASNSSTAIAYRLNSSSGTIDPPAFGGNNTGSWGAFTSYISSS